MSIICNDPKWTGVHTPEAPRFNSLKQFKPAPIAEGERLGVCEIFSRRLVAAGWVECYPNKRADLIVWPFCKPRNTLDQIKVNISECRAVRINSRGKITESCDLRRLELSPAEIAALIV